MSMFNDISCGTKDNEEECLVDRSFIEYHFFSELGPTNDHCPVPNFLAHKDTTSACARNLGQYRGKDVVGIRRKRMANFSVLRLLCPEVNSNAKGHGKLSIHFAATQATIETVFRIIVSSNQLSREMCEEYEFHHDRPGRPETVMGQLIEIKTEVPLNCDDPTSQNLQLQQYEERIERLSQQEKLKKFALMQDL